MPGEPAAPVLVDANPLIWAHHRRFPLHEPARGWWAETLSAVPTEGIPWVSSLAFLRISTHPRALPRPPGIGQAWAVVQGWLQRANVSCPGPGDLLVRGRAGGNHTPDAHLAALAIEWGLELCSADRDFARYPGLRWRNLLSRKCHDSTRRAPRWCAAGTPRGRRGDCGAGVPTEVHHLTYERLGAERDGDPVALCAPCHRGAHPLRTRKREALARPARRTLTRLEKQTGGGPEVETDELLRLEKGSKKALLTRLRALERADLVTCRGRGVRGDPQRWRALP
jgi:toxin-antitoxin system PIN domain toxin